MFGTIRKHSTWLWGIIIAAVAVGMVAYFGPANRSVDSVLGGKNQFGVIGGKNVTQEDYLRAVAEAKLVYLTTRGEWPGPDAQRQGYDLETEAYKRLFIAYKEKELGIVVSDDEVAKAAGDNLRAFARPGTQITMEQFLQAVLKPQGVTLKDYEQFLRHQIGVRQLISAISLPGKLVSEKEARTIFEHENKERSVQVVFFSASNYLSQIKVTPEELSNFYSNQVARYRVPDRIQVSYVEFKVTNFWAEAEADMAKMTNLPALLDQEYTRRGGTNFYTDLTAEEAKSNIKSELHEQLALRAASRRANEFADPILSAKTIRQEMLAEHAKEQGLPLQISEPFDRSTPPEGLNVDEQFVRAAFSLREDDPIGGPLVGRDAIYLFTKEKEIPSQIQPLDVVRSRVTQDYLQVESTRAARDAASAFVATATNDVAGGKAFTKVCSDAKVKPILLPPFSLNTRSLPEVEEHMSLQQLKQIAFTIMIGDVSPAVPTMEGAVVTYIQSELPLDEQKVDADLPEFIKLLRQARQQEAFEEWFGREANRVLATTPVMRERAPAAGAASN